MRHFRGTRNLVLAAAVVLAAGCLAAAGQALAADESASPAPASSPAGAKLQLKIGWTQDPDNLNPYIGYENNSYEIFSLQYDYLFSNYPDGTHGPELALERPTVENGGISADGRIVTVKIRPNVKWQDGKPLTARDVAFSYNYVIEKQLWNWTMQTAGIKRVEVVDDTTVKFICPKPKADLMSAGLPIVPEHIWGDVSGWAAQNTYQNKPPIVGSGPFQVVEVKQGRYIRLIRSPYYWGTRPTVDEVIFETYQNADSMVQELKAGTIDGAVGMPRALFMSVEDNDTIGSCAFNVLGFNYLYLNSYEGQSLGNPALRDVQLRRALNMAIDRQKLVDVAYGGMGEPGSTMINPDTWSNPDYHWEPSPEEALSFDLEKARQTLEAAGYKDSDGDGVREDKDGKPIKLRLWAAADSIECQSEGKLIVDWWSQIGIDVKLEVLDQGAIDDRFWNYEGSTYVPDFDAIIDVTAGYADPGQTVPWMTTAQIQNWNEPCWSDAEYDGLNDLQVSTMDLEKRAEEIQRMQQILYEAACYPVLTYPQTLEAYNTAKWTGWTPLGFGGSGDEPGPVFGAAGFNVETYINVKPASGAEADGGGLSTTTIVIIVVAALVVVAVVVWLVSRRAAGKKTVEDA
jgi:peptide/nickel transport system substrate-binding protein